MTNRTLKDILIAQLQRYPGMQLDDLYKLLHQAALGSEHAITNPSAARDSLQRELRNLAERKGEPLLERISPDGRLGRVHLRPFLLAGGDPDRLLQAFLETAENFPGDPRTFSSYLEIALDSAKHEDLPFESGAMEFYFRAMEEQGFPAVHHSDNYIRLYAPAYRVLQISTYPGLLDLHG